MLGLLIELVGREDGGDNGEKAKIGVGARVSSITQLEDRSILCMCRKFTG